MSNLYENIQAFEQRIEQLNSLTPTPASNGRLVPLVVISKDSEFINSKLEAISQKIESLSEITPTASSPGRLVEI